MGRIGLKAKLSTGVGEVKAKDVTVPDEFGQGDISCRGCPVELYIPTIRKLSIGWTMLWDEADTVFADILTNYHAGTDVTFTCISYDDGLGTTGSGITGLFQILKCDRQESLKEPVLAEIEIKPNGTMTGVAAAHPA